jgi:hypothetical protein
MLDLLRQALERTLASAAMFLTVRPERISSSPRRCPFPPACSPCPTSTSPWDHSDRPQRKLFLPSMTCAAATRLNGTPLDFSHRPTCCCSLARSLFRMSSLSRSSSLIIFILPLLFYSPRPLPVIARQHMLPSSFPMLNIQPTDRPSPIAHNDRLLPFSVTLLLATPLFSPSDLLPFHPKSTLYLQSISRESSVIYSHPSLSYRPLSALPRPPHPRRSFQLARKQIATSRRRLL